MNGRSLALGIITISVLTSADVRAARRGNFDHLSPLDFGDKKMNSYRSFLSQKLGLTPFDCGRVVDDASLGPEGMVSVYSRVQNDGRNFCVSSTEATVNIWQHSNSMRDIAQAQAVRIRRVDVEISAVVAEHIRQVWLRMLRRERPLKRSRIEFELAGYLRFSIQRPHGAQLEGELWLPPQGPKTQALVEISENLWKYCKASPAGRLAIATTIDREARQLLAQLK